MKLSLKNIIISKLNHDSNSNILFHALLILYLRLHHLQYYLTYYLALLHYLLHYLAHYLIG